MNITRQHAAFARLIETKRDVAHLSSRDLLRRDYKEYTFNTAEDVMLRVGLSTVPLGTKAWLEKEAQKEPGYRESLEAWAHERKLDVVGVLTTYRTANKGHHRRELLILVGGGITEPPSLASSDVIGNVEVLADALAKGLENQESLELEPRELRGEFADIKGPPGEHAHAKEVVGIVHIWRQNNVKATRKAIAPAFKSIIEGLDGIKSTFA